jgi:hypothetical protein
MVVLSGCLMVQPRKMQCWASMPYFRKPSFVLLGLPVSILLGGCGTRPECDSFETRNAVLQTVADDHNNALAAFAAKNPNPATSGDANSENEKQKPLYVLGEKMVTTSTSEDKRTLTCSGAISVTVGGTKASKELDFTVQRASDGKISVSVTPFQF